MNSRKRWAYGLMLVAAAALLATAILAEATEQVRTISGTVTALTLATKTIVVEAQTGNDSLIVGAEVPEGTSLKGVKGLADIKVGDRVTLQYVKNPDGLIAKSISRVASK